MGVPSAQFKIVKCKAQTHYLLNTKYFVQMKRLFFLITVLSLCSIGQSEAQKIDLSRYSYETPFVYKTASNGSLVEAEVWGTGRSLQFCNAFVELYNQAFTAKAIIHNAQGVGRQQKNYAGLVFWCSKELSSFSEYTDRYEVRIYGNGDLKIVQYFNGEEKVIASKKNKSIPDEYELELNTTSSGTINLSLGYYGSVSVETGTQISGSHWLGFCTCDGAGSKYFLSLTLQGDNLYHEASVEEKKIDVSAMAMFSQSTYPKTLETKCTGCIAGDCFEGFGYYIANDKVEYAGYFSNGTKKGIGQIHMVADNALYNGFFDNDQPNGYGNLNYYANPIIEVGTFVNNQQDGKFFIYKDDKVKTGLYQGSQITDIEIKSECLSGDCDNGTGVYQMSNGNHYEGTFTGGRFVKGVMFKDKEKVCQFETYNADGTYSGLTDIFFNNGGVTHGTYSNGKMNGQFLIKSPIGAKTLCVEGTFENSIGTNITVQFRDGRKWIGKQDSETASWATGTGTMTYPDGTTKTGKFNDGEFVSE
jgi:hypothetical protein